LISVFSVSRSRVTPHEEIKGKQPKPDPFRQPSAKGWRIKYSGEKRSVVDGPFAETKELIAGYTIIQVKSKEEALEWTKRFPNPVVDGKEGEIEVRQLFELEDFEPGEAVERFRELGVGTEK